MKTLTGTLEAKEAAERAAVTRTIREARDCWQQIGKSNSFEAYVIIGRGLCIGKAWAMRAANTNRAWGARYSRCFNEWMVQHGFTNMLKSTRSHCIELVENLPAIEQWRSTLPEKQRRRLQGPQQNVRRWRRETQQAAEPHHNNAATALAAWRRFVSCVKSLPADQESIVWPAVLAEATALAT